MNPCYPLRGSLGRLSLAKKDSLRSPEVSGGPRLSALGSGFGKRLSHCDGNSFKSIERSCGVLLSQDPSTVEGGGPDCNHELGPPQVRSP